MNYLVSVVVCIYNPIWEKLKRTLMSIIQQKGIEFEVVICDDGSKNNCFDLIKDFLEEKDYKNYKLISSDSNQGTVKNCINGTKEACGEYIYVISPGDFLYNQSTLYDMYDFTKQNETPISFGNAVYYQNIDKEGNIILAEGVLNHPYYPDVYSEKSSQLERIVSFFMGGYGHGATFLLDRLVALKYFEAISPNVVFCEDYGSIALQLFDDVKMSYYNKYVVWYEYGTGVSTNGSDFWNNAMAKDVQETIQILKNRYNDNRVLCGEILMSSTKNKWEKMKKIVNLLRLNPKFMYYFIRLKMKKIKFVNYSEINYDFLNKIL